MLHMMLRGHEKDLAVFFLFLHLIAGPFISRKIFQYCVAEIGGGGELQHGPVHGVIIT